MISECVPWSDNDQASKSKNNNMYSGPDIHLSRVAKHLAATVLIALMFSCAQTSPSGDSIRQAFERHESNVRVQGEGVVSRVLPDDNQGDRHQRFIVRTSSGQTVLIDHNIDIARRIPDLKVGDSVEFSGEYV